MPQVPTRYFLSQEPCGFEAGDPNFYRYVGNHPTNATDPSGRAEKHPLREKYAEFLDFLVDAQGQGQRLTLDTKVKMKAYDNAPISWLLEAHCLDVVEGCDMSDSGAYAGREFQRLLSTRSGDRALSSADVALLSDLIRGKFGGEALGAPYDANGKRVLPEFSMQRGFGFTPDGTYVYYKPGIGWVSPCVVCHGRNADGPLPGLTPTDSFVDGRWYHSGDNLNILRNYSAGVASTIANVAPNLINLGVYAKRTLTSSADGFDFSPFIDTTALGEKVEDFVYPNRDRGSLVTTAGRVGGEVPAFFAAGGLIKAGGGLLGKGMGWLRAGRASGGADGVASLGTSSIQVAGPGAEFQIVVSGPGAVFQTTVAPGGANVAARGMPFAFGGLSRDARAGRLLYEAAQASGLQHYRGLVDRVLYESKGASPYFWVDPATGERIIAIDAATFGKTKPGQLIAGTHELVHAEQWAQHLTSHGGNLAAAHPTFFVPNASLQYAMREVLTERAALQRVASHLGGLSPQQVGHSTRYIEWWQQFIQALGGTPVP